MEKQLLIVDDKVLKEMDTIIVLIKSFLENDIDYKQFSSSNAAEICYSALINQRDEIAQALNLDKEDKNE